jgi:hypothetical protein
VRYSDVLIELFQIEIADYLMEMESEPVSQISQFEELNL